MSLTSLLCLLLSVVVLKSDVKIWHTLITEAFMISLDAI